MKRNTRFSLSLAVLFIFLATAVYAMDSVSVSATHFAPITQQLIFMVEHNPELKSMLIESIAKAKEINPDPVTNPAQTLEEFYAFVDWASTALPWSLLPNLPYSSLYDRIDQSLCYFYFITDQPLSSLEGKGYYNNSLQYHEPYRTWMIHFTREWGLNLSEEDSWTDAYYQNALEDVRFGLQEGWYEDPSNWKTFNDFFARHLRSPKERPITEPSDPSILVAPADSKMQGIWAIDQNSQILVTDGLRIKSDRFLSVATLMGEESPYKDSFFNGTLTHTFLDIFDYHRYHFPIDGIIREVRIIRSDVAAGGITIWDPTTSRYVLESTTPDWQGIQTRGLVIVETEDYGMVAILPIGMSQISSVNFEETVRVGGKVKKGDPLGYFLFGGSNIVMLFQEGVEFALMVPKEGEREYAHRLMGEAYGRLTIKK